MTTTPQPNTSHRMRLLQVLAWGAIASVAFPSRAGAQDLPPSLAQFLQQTIALTQDELSAATRGEPVVKLLETPDSLEIGVFGIVRIGVPRSFYVRQAADFPASLREPTRRKLALFSDPVVPSDVALLTVPQKDVGDLAHCRPASCKLKLSAAAIAGLPPSPDPDSPAADSAFNTYFRGRMVDYVTAYRAQGNASLLTYVDQKSPTGAAQVFDAILSRSQYLHQYAPSLERYLQNYPKDRPPDLREALFWAEDDIPNVRPTISITHEVVYAPPELPGTTLIAAKLLYANHYVDGALTLTAIVDQTGGQAAAPDGIYLIRFRRLHFDHLPSGGVMNIKGKATGQLRDRMKSWLSDTKTKSEAAYKTKPS